MNVTVTQNMTNTNHVLMTKTMKKQLTPRHRIKATKKLDFVSVQMCLFFITLLSTAFKYSL